MNESIMGVKTLFVYFLFSITLVSQIRANEQVVQRKESNQSNETDKIKKHFISINPIKPFIGLPNIHYEYQLRKKFGMTAFAEVLAYTVIPDFDHPDAVNTVGFSFYPFMGNRITNRGAFINGNISYVIYFRNKENSNSNSFSNGAQIGYKWLLKNRIFIEPKLLLNYVYREKGVLPGFEVLLGIRLQ